MWHGYRAKPTERCPGSIRTVTWTRISLELIKTIKSANSGHRKNKMMWNTLLIWFMALHLNMKTFIQYVCRRFREENISHSSAFVITKRVWLFPSCGMSLYDNRETCRHIVLHLTWNHKISVRWQYFEAARVKHETVMNEVEAKSEIRDGIQHCVHMKAAAGHKRWLIFVVALLVSPIPLSAFLRTPRLCGEPRRRRPDAVHRLAVTVPGGRR